MLSAQDYLEQAFRINRFVEDLKKTPEFDPNNVNLPKVKYVEEIFPPSFNSYILKNDKFLQSKVEIKRAHEELNTKAE